LPASPYKVSVTPPSEAGDDVAAAVEVSAAAADVATDAATDVWAEAAADVAAAGVSVVLPEPHPTRRDAAIADDNIIPITLFFIHTPPRGKLSIPLNASR
jgi:hypothetical protein